jgi:hypothetical protein
VIKDSVVIKESLVIKDFVELTTPGARDGLQVAAEVREVATDQAPGHDAKSAEHDQQPRVDGCGRQDEESDQHDEDPDAEDP